MRSAINTALFILFLLLAFLTSVASYANVFCKPRAIGAPVPERAEVKLNSIF